MADTGEQSLIGHGAHFQDSLLYDLSCFRKHHSLARLVLYC